MKKIITVLFAALMAASSAFAQSTSFDARYEEAKGYYTSGNYARALESLNHTLGVETLSPEQREQVKMLTNQCKQKIEASRTLSISRTDFSNISFLGDTVSTYVYVPSKKAWKVSSCPDWISYEKESDMVLFTVHENPNHTTRRDAVQITLDRTNLDYINFAQEARPDTEKKVTITSVPESAALVIDGDPKSSPTSLIMKSGEHTIKASRDMYNQLDTVIVIEDDMVKEQVLVNLKLTRQFATVQIGIVDEDGEELKNMPTFYIGNKVVDLRPKTLGDYNENKKIEFYSLYKDGTIPIHADASHNLRASAPGYYDETFKIPNAMADSSYSHVFKLSPKAGFLNVVNLFDSEGADIYIDGKIVHGKQVPCDSIKILTGKHVVSFRKEGMIPAQESYPIDIIEGEVSKIELSMTGCDTYTFAGMLPVGASVIIDSTEVGKTPLTITMIKGRHELHIQKPGYRDIYDFLEVEGTNRHVEYENLMEATMPFSVITDEDRLMVTISRDGKTYIADALTPATVQIPLSDSDYDYVIERGRRDKRKLAYKGSFRFDNPEKNTIHIQAWSDQFFHILEGEYFLSNNTLNVFGKNYTERANLGFLNLKLFKGMSTSLAKAKLFTSKDESPMVYGENTLESKKLLPAFSCILINEDLRIGGAIFQYMDANLLASYTWYPDMTSFLPVSHASGHNVFAGLEIASRFPCLTISLKAGYETMINGKANIYDKKIGPTSHSTADCFISTPLNYGQFVFGINVSIADSSSKGNNIIRIF